MARATDIRFLIPLALAAVMAGCASAPDPAMRETIPPPVAGPAGETPVARAELAPQHVAPGACASFFWSADAAHRFLVFENETDGVARVFLDGETQSFSVPANPGVYLTGEAFHRRYTDPARGLDLTISGTVGDAVTGGLRIERAVMRRRLASGETLVQPLAGHHVCRSAVSRPE